MDRKWNSSLPNEILALITQAVGNEDRLVERKKIKWMMVNKQWYDQYQSIKYKSVSISLNLSNITLRNIIFSKFLPGKWVKSLTFQTITAAANLMNCHVLVGDPLQLLMTYCLM